MPAQDSPPAKATPPDQDAASDRPENTESAPPESRSEKLAVSEEPVPREEMKSTAVEVTLPPAGRSDVGVVNRASSTTDQALESVGVPAGGDGLAAGGTSEVASAQARGEVAPREDVQPVPEAEIKDGVKFEVEEYGGVSKEIEAAAGTSVNQSEPERVGGKAESGVSEASEVGPPVGQTVGHPPVETVNQSVSLRTPMEALPAWILAKMTLATASESGAHEKAALSETAEGHQAEWVAPSEEQPQTEHVWSEANPVETTQSAGAPDPEAHKVEPLQVEPPRTEALEISPRSKASKAEAFLNEALNIKPPPSATTTPPQVANPFNQSNQGGFGGQTPKLFGAFTQQPEGFQPQSLKPFGSPPSNPEGLSQTPFSSSPGGFADLDAAIMAAKQSRFKKPGVSPTGYAHPPEKWVKKEPVAVWLPTSAAAPAGPEEALWVSKAESVSVPGAEIEKSLHPQENFKTKPEETTPPVKEPEVEAQGPSVSPLGESDKAVKAAQYASKANGDVSAQMAASKASVAAPLSRAGSDVSRTSADVSVEAAARKSAAASGAVPLGEPPKPSAEPSLSNRRDLLMQLITQRWRAPLSKQPLVRAEARSDDSGSEHDGAPVHTRRAASHSPSEGSEKAVKTAGGKRETERGPEARPIEMVPFPGYTAVELRERHTRLEQKRQEEAEHTRGVNGHQQETARMLKDADGQTEETKGQVGSENGPPREADGVNGGQVRGENEHPRSFDLFSGVASGASANGRNWTEEDIPTRAAAWEANLQRAGLVSGSTAPGVNKHAAPRQSSAGDLAMSQRAMERLAAKVGGLKFAWVPKDGGGSTSGKHPPGEETESREIRRGEAGETDAKSTVGSITETAVSDGGSADESEVPAGSLSGGAARVAPEVDDVQASADTASGAAEVSGAREGSAPTAGEAEEPVVPEAAVSEQPASTGRSDEFGQREVVPKVHSDDASQSDQVPTATDGSEERPRGPNGTGKTGPESDGSGEERTVLNGPEDTKTILDGSGESRPVTDNSAERSESQQPAEVGVSDVAALETPTATEAASQVTSKMGDESASRAELQEATPSGKAELGSLDPSALSTAAGSDDVSAVERDASRGQGQGDASGGQSDVSSREADVSGGPSASTPKPKPKMLWSDDVDESEAAEMRFAATGERPTSSGQGDVRLSSVSANHSRGIGSLGNSLPVETTVMGTPPRTAEGERTTPVAHQKSGSGTGGSQWVGSEVAAKGDANQNGLGANPSVSKSDGDVWTFPEEALLPSESPGSPAKAARSAANKALSSGGLVGEDSAIVEGSGAAAKARTGPAAKKMVLDPSDERFERIFLEVSEKLAFRMGRPFDISVLNSEVGAVASASRSVFHFCHSCVIFHSLPKS